MAVATMKLQVFCWNVLLLASGSRIILRDTGAVDPWLGHGFWMHRLHFQYHLVPRPEVFTGQVCQAHLTFMGFKLELSFS